MKKLAGVLFLQSIVAGLACSNNSTEFGSKAIDLSDTTVEADILTGSSENTDVRDGSADAQSGSVLNGDSADPANGATDAVTSSDGAITPQPPAVALGNSKKERGSPKNSTLQGSTSQAAASAGVPGTEYLSYHRKFKESFSVDQTTLGGCGAYFSGNLQDGKISGSKNTISSDGSRGIPFKVTGNRNKLAVNFKGVPETKPKFEGICVFIAGNQNVVDVLVKDVIVKRIILIARGNQAKVNIKVEGGGDINEVVFDGKGNSPALEITGPATFPCQDRVKTISGGKPLCKVLN